MKIAKDIWVQFNRQRSLYQERGVGVTTRGGSLGWTYGQRGYDCFRSITVHLMLWSFELRVDWKSLKDWED